MLSVAAIIDVAGSVAGLCNVLVAGTTRCNMVVPDRSRIPPYLLAGGPGRANVPVASTVPNYTPIGLILLFAIAVPLLAFGAVLIVDFRRGKRNLRLAFVVLMLALVLLLLAFGLVAWWFEGAGVFV